MIKMRVARARRTRSPFALNECEAAVLALLQGRSPKQAKKKAS